SNREMDERRWDFALEPPMYAATKRLVLAFSSVLLADVASAQSPADVAPPLSAAETDQDAAARFVTSLLREHLPRDYEDTRKWGATKRMWDGLHIQLDGLRLKTKRRWKQANHGTWKMYRVWLLDPNEQLDLSVMNVRRQEDGSVAFDLHAGARLGLMGRVSEWRHDVQLFSFSAEGAARVRVALQCQAAMRLDPRKLPPDLVLAPKVNAADLVIEEFHIDRVSKVGGDVAEEIGREIRRSLEEKLAEDRTDLADKLNRQIAKNEDKLRLSLHDALASKWGSWIETDSLEESLEDAPP
ncbi:MAG: hypothetical protein KY475_26085, partial [Planctomycetes bacterium]|nr:hypothetical protein [Planctomycetota bacterium]